MTPEDNKKVVQDAYAAFGRGDIPALLKTVTDDVEWEGVVGAGPSVPMRGKKKGPKQVAEFFELVGANVDFKRFEPRSFIAEGDIVVVLGYYESTIKTTKRTFGSDWVMVFTMRGGKIARFQEFTDSLGLTNAY